MSTKKRTGTIIVGHSIVAISEQRPTLISGDLMGRIRKPRHPNSRKALGEVNMRVRRTLKRAGASTVHGHSRGRCESTPNGRHPTRPLDPRMINGNGTSASRAANNPRSCREGYR